jgi:hypothetical protein
MRQGFVPLKVPSNSDANAVRLQRKATNSEALDSVPPIVNDVLASSGRPLDTTTRNFMEDRFGHDFSEVRVHTDSRAAESAQAVSAKAYTVGQNVVFGKDHYSPATGEGMRLFAHELAHVIQQGKSGQTSLPSLSQDSPGEQEADRAASLIDHCDGPIHVGISTARGLARQEDTDDELTRTLRAANRDAHKPKQETFRDLSAFGTRPSGAPVGQAAPRTEQRVDTVGMLAEQGISLEASYRKTHFNSEREALDFMERYIAYTKDKPHLQPQYREAIDARRRILAERELISKQRNQENARKQQEQKEAVKIKAKDDEEFRKSQRWTLLGALMPDSVQPYYKDPSREVTNPVYRMHAETNTGAAFSGARLARDTTAAVSAAVGTIMLVAEGALALDALVMIALEGAAASQAATPIMSIIVNNPIAAEQLAIFAGETVLSIVVAGGVKQYIDSLATPEGIFNIGVQIFLHGSAFSSRQGGGSSGRGVGRGNIKSVTPDGKGASKVSIQLSKPPEVDNATPPAVAPSQGANKPQTAPQRPQATGTQVPDKFQKVVGTAPGSHANDTLPSNVTPLRQPQPIEAPQVAAAAGQDFTPAQPVQTSTASGTSRKNDTTVASAGKSSGSTKTITSTPSGAATSTSSVKASGSKPAKPLEPTEKPLAKEARDAQRKQEILDEFEEGQSKTSEDAKTSDTRRDTPGGRPQPRQFQRGNFAHKFAEFILGPNRLPRPNEAEVVVELQDGTGDIIRTDRIIRNAEEGLLIEIKPSGRSAVKGRAQLPGRLEALQREFPKRNGWHGQVVEYTRADIEAWLQAENVPPNDIPRLLTLLGF